MPSLIKLSPSIIIPNRLDTVNSLKSATTEMGSVAANIAAASSTNCQLNFSPSENNSPTPINNKVVSSIPTITPGMARNRMARLLFRNDLRST